MWEKFFDVCHNYGSMVAVKGGHNRISVFSGKVKVAMSKYVVLECPVQNGIVKMDISYTAIAKIDASEMAWVIINVPGLMPATYDSTLPKPLENLEQLLIEGYAALPDNTPAEGRQGICDWCGANYLGTVCTYCDSWLD